MPGKFPTEEILDDGDNENGATQVHVNGVSREGAGKGRQDWSFNSDKHEGERFVAFGYESDHGMMAVSASPKHRKR